MRIRIYNKTEDNILQQLQEVDTSPKTKTDYFQMIRDFNKIHVRPLYIYSDFGEIDPITEKYKSIINRIHYFIFINLVYILLFIIFTIICLEIF